MPRVLRILRRTFLALLITAILCIMAAFIIVRYYEDDVVGYAVTRINEQLATRATVGAVDLTFWENFPKASLRFSDVYIEEDTPDKDTLLYARGLFLSFDLIDLFTGEYTIREVEFDAARAYLKVDKKGKDNWHFWKESPGDSSQFRVDIDGVVLSDTRVVYENRASEFFLDVTAAEARAKGAFSSIQFEVSSDMEGQIHSLISGVDTYADERPFTLDTELLANTEAGTYTFNDTRLRLSTLSFAMTGKVQTDPDLFLDLTILGDRMDLDDVRQALPERFRAAADGYDAEGTIETTIRIHGKSSGKDVPVVTAEAHLSGGSIGEQQTGIAMEAIQADLAYAYSASGDKFTIQTLSARLGGGTVQASGHMVQLKDPVADLQVNASVGIDALVQFLKIDTIASSSGQLDVQATLRGQLRTPEGSTDWSRLSMAGNAALRDATFQLRQSNRVFSGVQGQLTFDGVNARVEQLSGIVNGCDFRLDGSLNNILPFLIQEGQRLGIDARFQSKFIDYANLVESAASSTPEEDMFFRLPDDIDFRLNTSIERFVFKTFEARAISGVLLLQAGRLLIDPVSFQMADGTLQSQIRIDPMGANDYSVRCTASLRDLDIRKLFLGFDNFGQHFITAEHLRGKASADVTFDAPLSSGFRIDTDKVHSLVDIRILNGELISFDPLQSIADYIRSNKWIAPFVNEERFAEKLAHVKFSTLENVIRIEDRTIHIPFMDIRSSAMDISVQGTHTFDNAIDYTIGFRLRDILLRRDKEWIESDDGLGKQLFLYMRGTTENPEFGMDKDAARENRDAEIAVEKQNMKALLKEELGLFRKDASVGTYVPEEEKRETTTTIEWEELDTQDAPAPAPKTPKKDPAPTPAPTESDKKLPKWLREKQETESDE